MSTRRARAFSESLRGLCIAERAGRRFARDKAHFFTIARGSATESAAVLDLLLARGLVSPANRRHGRGLVVRVVHRCSRA